MIDATLPSIRLVFELTHADNPRLYTELMRFQKGSKRVNRLRLLAYDGLLAQAGVFTTPEAEPQYPEVLEEPDRGSGALTNQLFGPSLDD